MNISVIGAGYVGLVTAAGFAELGHRVRCADLDEERIRVLHDGGVPIFEPGLDPIVSRNRRAGRLAFTVDPSEAIEGADVVFCAVNTPQGDEGAADLSAVLAVAERVRHQVRQRTTFVLKSTVPVGTHARVTRLLAGSAAPVEVVSNPEFLREGTAVDDFFAPDRIVLGVQAGHATARDRMTELYAPLAENGAPVLWMEPASAELTKYVSNAMLAMRIAFMNEVAALCERVGADVHQVREGVGSDRRIGPAFLYASCGYGGSCFPKDVQALVHTAAEHGIDLTLARSTHLANERQKQVLLGKLRRRFDGDLQGRRVAVWGAAFKPRTDDIRNSPALDLIDGLLEDGAEVVVHDPAATEGIARRYGDRVATADCPYEACRDAEALVLVTEWSEYRRPDFRRIAGLLRRQLVIDGRNVWSDVGLGDMGFLYEGIGVRA